MFRHKKADRRVLKSKRAIKKAFDELISRKNINEITVKEVADMADVDRKTFYSYYKAVSDVRNEQEDEFVQKLEDSLDEINFVFDIKEPGYVLVALSEILASNAEFMSNLLSRGADTNILTKLEKSLTEKIQHSQTMRELGEKTDIYYLSKMISNSVISSYTAWVKSDRRKNLSEVAKNLGDFLFYGISGLQSSSKAKVN